MSVAAPGGKEPHSLSASSLKWEKELQGHLPPDPLPPHPPSGPVGTRGGGEEGRGKRSRSNPFHFFEKALHSSSLLVLFFPPSLSYLHGFPVRALSFALYTTQISAV